MEVVRDSGVTVSELPYIVFDKEASKSIFIPELASGFAALAPKPEMVNAPEAVEP